MVEIAGKPLASLTAFPMPGLRVGSLDSLLTLSDELARLDGTAEALLKKAERFVAETYFAIKGAERARKVAGGADGAAEPPIPPLQLYCVGKKVQDWLPTFQWTSASFDEGEALPELARRIQGDLEKVDVELRATAAAYTEKKTALQNAERKKSANLMAAPLEEVVTAKALQDANAEWVPSDSEFLATVLLVVPATSEESFLDTYHTLDAEAVPAGPKGKRESVRVSPVVPRSARKIASDRDGYLLYSVVVLKHFLETIRAAARERRYTVRDFSYTPGLSGAGARAFAELSAAAEGALSSLKDVSRRKFEEVLFLWMHIKTLRLHVDSVLRYGLPPSYSVTLFRLEKGEGRRALDAARAAWPALACGHAAFDAMYGTTGGKGRAEDGDGEEDGGAAATAPDPAIAGVTDGTAATQLPFVYLEFELRADTAAGDKK